MEDIKYKFIYTDVQGTWHKDGTYTSVVTETELTLSQLAQVIIAKF